MSNNNKLYILKILNRRYDELVIYLKVLEMEQQIYQDEYEIRKYEEGTIVQEEIIRNIQKIKHELSIVRLRIKFIKKVIK